jgi:hypothetical protein
MRVLLLALLVLGTGYFWAALQIPLDPWAAEEAINSRTLPLLYGASLCGLVVMLAISARTEHLARIAVTGIARVAGLVASMLLFAVMVPRVGVWLAVPFLLVPAMWILGERRWWALSLLPLASAAVAWLVVVRWLGLYVQPGSWLS